METHDDNLLSVVEDFSSQTSPMPAVFADVYLDESDRDENEEEDDRN